MNAKPYTAKCGNCGSALHTFTWKMVNDWGVAAIGQHTEQVCPTCEPLQYDEARFNALLSRAPEYPTCETSGCDRTAMPGRKFCLDCRDEMEAVAFQVLPISREKADRICWSVIGVACGFMAWNVLRAWWKF